METAFEVAGLTLSARAEGTPHSPKLRNGKAKLYSYELMVTIFFNVQDLLRV